MHSRSARLLARSALVALVLAIALAPSAYAHKPMSETTWFADTDASAEEAAAMSASCGFAVDALVEGHVIVRLFDGDAQRMRIIATWATRVTYTNPASGASVRVRDAGPDRIYVKDGRMYFAFTGRATTSTGVIGVTTYDWDTGELVFQAGRDAGDFRARVCSALG